MKPLTAALLALLALAALPGLAMMPSCEQPPQAGDGHQLFFVTDVAGEQGELLGVLVEHLDDLDDDPELSVGLLWVTPATGARTAGLYDVVPSSLAADRRTARVRSTSAELSAGRVVAELPAGPTTPEATLSFDLDLGGLSNGSLSTDEGELRFTAVRGVRAALPVRRR